MNLKAYARLIAKGVLLAAVVIGECPPMAAAQAVGRGVLRERLRQRLEAKRDAGETSRGAIQARLEEARKNAGETIELAGLKVSVWRPAQRSGRVPLVIFSHGFHGLSTQSTFLTAVLAENGYLVLAPNHKDALGNGGFGAGWLPEASFTQPGQWSDKTYRNRADDICRLVKALHETKPWSETIDWSRFALAGHSLGGYTALGLAGAWPSWKLPEVKAVLAFSPYAAPYLQKPGLARLGVPVMYQGGTRDFGITPFVQRRGGVYDQTAAPAYFVEFEQAGHLAWTDLVADYQAKIKYYSLAFLNKYLKGDPQANPALKQAGVAELKVK